MATAYQCFNTYTPHPSTHHNASTNIPHDKWPRQGKSTIYVQVILLHHIIDPKLIVYSTFHLRFLVMQCVLN